MKHKLTAVSIRNGSKQVQAFVKCPVDDKTGKTHVPMQVFNTLVTELTKPEMPRGHTITIG